MPAVLTRYSGPTSSLSDCRKLYSHIINIVSIGNRMGQVQLRIGLELKTRMKLILYFMRNHAITCL